MKKIVLLLAVASLLVGIPSCKKEEKHHPPIQQTMNVELKENQSYTFTLPKNKRNDAYDITTQASHYSISEVGQDNSGNRIYQYTPSLNFMGTDQVVVANPEEGQGHPDGQGHPHGHCDHHDGGSHHDDADGGEEDHYIITINFTVATNSTATNK